MAVCMDCRCVLPMRRRPTWEDLAAMFEGSTASGAERAYKKAVQKLTQLLIEDGLFYTIVLKRKRQKKRKEKIAVAVCLVQVGCGSNFFFSLFLTLALQNDCVKETILNQ